MRKLIAQRSIQYLGRCYAPGATLPTFDTRLVAAWLSADSAAWTEETAGQYAEHASRASDPAADMLAADVLRAMGVTITNDAGLFVGDLPLLDQIFAAVAGDETTDTRTQENDASGIRHAASEKAQPTLHNRLSAAQLERLTKDELLNLAADLGVDLSAAKNNAERAARLAAAPGKDAS